MMATVRFELGQGDGPFKFQKGDRVVVHQAGQPWHFGAIVGGYYEGPPPEAGSGFYRITYWIRRNDGHLFEADESDVREPAL